MFTSSFMNYLDNLGGKLENLKQDNNLVNPTYITTLENSWYFFSREYITDQGELVEDW